MKTLRTLILGAAYLFTCLVTYGQNEAYYVDRIAEKWRGKTQYQVENGRVDILTDDYAIEVEWAENWKHSIGQSLWYALQTNRKAGIVLIIKEIKDRKHGVRLQTTLDRAGLTDAIKVWFYPEDFGGDYDSMKEEGSKYRQELIPRLGEYTINKNTKVRHNSRCTHFDCKNCVPCSSEDGKACGKCGG